MRTQRYDFDTLIVEDHPWLFVVAMTAVGAVLWLTVDLAAPGPDWLLPLWTTLAALAVAGFTRVTIDRDEGQAVWTQRRLGVWVRKRRAPIADIEEVLEGAAPLLRFTAQSGRASWPLSTVRASLGLNANAVANIRAFLHHTRARVDGDDTANA